LPEIANRHQGEACCSSAICDWTLKSENYILSQIGNAIQMHLYFDMLSNYIVNDIGAKSVVIKTSGSKKMQVTVMLAVLADGSKLQPLVIRDHETMP
jgi:hypothetical protein